MNGEPIDFAPLLGTLFQDITDPAILTLLAIGAGLIAIVVVAIWATSRVYDRVALNRRIQRLSGDHADLEELHLSLDSSPERVEALIGRLLPSLNQTSRKFRQAGLKVNIRTYVFFVLFLAGLMAIMIKMPAVPSWGKPILFLVGLHFAFEQLVLRMLINKRRVRILQELPIAVDYMVRSLRSGQGIEMAIQMAADACQDPLRGYLAEIPRLLKVGTPLVDAVDIVAQEMQMREFDFLAAACRAQMETGGNLANVMAGLSNTIRARHHLQLKISAMASEGKFSGFLLATFPFALLAYFTWANPKYVAPLYTTEIGHNLLLAAGVMVFIAIFAIRQITNFKV